MPPTMMSGGPGQPQYHFIANKQKFYAQVTPDKAQLIMRYVLVALICDINSDKRPFTAANPMAGVVNSQAVGGALSSHSTAKR